MYLLKFKKTLVEKIWGGKQFEEKLNFKLPKETLYGESWEVSCHKNGMSYIANGEFENFSFEELLKKYPVELLGEEIIKKYGDKFPILIKYLDINDKLSVQVHPDDEYSLKQENEFGKSEAWYIMDASENAKLIVGLKNDITLEKYNEKIKNNDFNGIFNEVKVKKGDFINIEPGIVHGTLSGSILVCEVQQNSDITYRIYDFDREIKGVKRELHLDKAIDVIEFGKNVNISSDETRKKIKVQDAVVEKLVTGEHFSIDKLFVNGVFHDEVYKNFKIYSILDGSGALFSEEIEYKVEKGDTYFIPANKEVKMSGNLEIIKSYV